MQRLRVKPTHSSDRLSTLWPCLTRPRCFLSGWPSSPTAATNRGGRRALAAGATRPRSTARQARALVPCRLLHGSTATCLSPRTDGSRRRGRRPAIAVAPHVRAAREGRRRERLGSRGTARHISFLFSPTFRPSPNRLAERRKAGRLTAHFARRPALLLSTEKTRGSGTHALEKFSAVADAVAGGGGSRPSIPADSRGCRRRDRR